MISGTEKEVLGSLMPFLSSNFQKKSMEKTAAGSNTAKLLDNIRSFMHLTDPKGVNPSLETLMRAAKSIGSVKEKNTLKDRSMGVAEDIVRRLEGALNIGNPSYKVDLKDRGSSYLENIADVFSNDSNQLIGRSLGGAGLGGVAGAFLTDDEQQSTPFGTTVRKATWKDRLNGALQGAVLGAGLGGLSKAHSLARSKDLNWQLDAARNRYISQFGEYSKGDLADKLDFLMKDPDIKNSLHSLNMNKGGLSGRARGIMEDANAYSTPYTTNKYNIADFLRPLKDENKSGGPLGRMWAYSDNLAEPLQATKMQVGREVNRRLFEKLLSPVIAADNALRNVPILNKILPARSLRDMLNLSHSQSGIVKVMERNAKKYAPDALKTLYEAFGTNKLSEILYRAANNEIDSVVWKPEVSKAFDTLITLYNNANSNAEEKLRVLSNFLRNPGQGVTPITSRINN